MSDPNQGPVWRAAIQVPADQVEIYDDVLAEASDGASVFEVPDSDNWLIEAFFSAKPDRIQLGTLLAIAAVANNVPEPQLELVELGDIDWVKSSLAQLKPVSAGRFYIYGSHNEETPPENSIRVLIEAGRAFGTGQHETTKGCLLAIDQICHQAIRKPLDVGTGTGVLAIAIAKLTGIPVTASDIDPVSVAAAQDNADQNQVGNLVQTIEANGLDHAKIQSAEPYDLVVANILAKPLMALAPEITGILANDGWIVLSGILKKQRQGVLDAYLPLGVQLVDQYILGDWPTLVFKKSA